MVGRRSASLLLTRLASARRVTTRFLTTRPLGGARRDRGLLQGSPEALGSHG